ncbi:FAD-dependent oxidoreductase [Bacteroidota bacterium]
MDVGRHPNIELITLAQVTSLKGRAGDFKATVHIKPRYVNADLCTGCGDCTRACPQMTQNVWDLGLAARKAIYRPYPQAVPSTYVIDIDTCLNSPEHFVCERCRRTCKRDAIDHDMRAYDRELEVGSVIVATGFEEFHPHVMKNYGYGTWQNVMTSLEFERLLNASGPTMGHVIRPSDRKVPKNLVYVQCVGARGEGGRPNCSRYCCMNAVKDALLIKQHEPDVESCTILYTDIRAFGKGFDSFVQRANEEDYIHFVRGRPSKLMEVENDDIEIFVEDTEIQKQLRLKADLVVLSCAGIPNPEAQKLGEALGIDINEIGFFRTTAPDKPIATNREGVFVCGSAGGPQVIPDCVAQASAAAAEASYFVKDHKLPEQKPITPREIPPDEKPRIGVFVCKCGANIGRVVKTEALAEEASKFPNVVYSGVELFACADTGQNSIKEKIVEHKLNRVIVAACTPRTHEPVFRNACLEAGLNPYLFEMANIRDQCTWVHAKEKEKAYGKSLDLIRMATARSAKLKPLEPAEVSLTRHVLVVGGGVAGMQSALELESLDIDVTLIEATEKLGGRVKNLHATFPHSLDGKNPADTLMEKIKDSGVNVLLNTQIKGISGFIGNFEIELEGSDESKKASPLKVGSIIVAIGSKLHQPGEEWKYGKVPNVITSMDLEDILMSGDEEGKLKGIENIAFIQCVGSRCEDEGYAGCSRYCCPASVKQAVELKGHGINSTILYRDMRMVGQGAEEFYRKARKEGVLFLRYDHKNPPKLEGTKKITNVSVHDTLIEKDINVPADLVVLAVGMVNEKEYSETLRNMLKVPRGEDGFFMERHPELGPVETCIDGVFLCGTIQGPKDISDTLTQAKAAAGKVAELLSKEKIMLEPVVCEVHAEKCRGCGECVNICEYHAPSLEVQKDGTVAAVINKALCKGCGTCAVWCPTNAINAVHFTDNQIGAMITALFEDYHIYADSD